jgi:hypothetical protein
MKIDVQYITDSHGNINAVQLPISEWEKLNAKVRRYEQMLKMKSDLTEAFEQVKQLRKSKAKEQTFK